MRVLIITTKRISSTQLAELNKHYSVLSITKQHLKKSILQLGSSELTLLNLNFGMIHGPSNCEELKWINQQDLSGFKTIYVYSKPKYMKSFVRANLVLKSLPVIVGRTLEAVIAMSERMADGSRSVSLSQDELKAITEEIQHEITPDDIIQAMNKYKQLQHDYVELEKICDRLRAEAVKVIKEPEPEPVLKRQDNVSQLNDVISKLGAPPKKEPEQKKPVKPVKSLKHVKNGIQLIKDSKIIDTLTFHNRSEQREARRTAMKWVRD